MPINLIVAPNSTPTAVADYQSQNNLINALAKKADVIPWTGSDMNDGYIFQIGGAVYQVDGATAITGTPSPYVQITASGATASAAFVASLSGVTWNSVYNGYYDGSGRLYLFDEVGAIDIGQLSTIRNNWILPSIRNTGNNNSDAKSSSFTIDTMIVGEVRAYNVRLASGGSINMTFPSVGKYKTIIRSNYMSTTGSGGLYAASGELSPAQQYRVYNNSSVVNFFGFFGGGTQAVYEVYIDRVS
jgi:hypothetical protein